MSDNDFQIIFDSDEDGLLDTPEKAPKLSSSDRLERSFIEIVEFYREHERPPRSDTPEIAERKLGARLDGILANDDKIAALKHLDEFELLAEPEAPASLEDLLEGDDLGLLHDDSGLLDTSDLPQRKGPEASVDSAQRVRAEDFEQFEPLFQQKHAELAEGTARLVSFPGLRHITEGSFFVLNGVMLFIADVGETEYKETTVRANRRERLRVIFENGTESSMYRQSLGIRMGEGDGQAVVAATFESVLADDVETGYIYVLRSLSDDPQVASVPDLYKIGFSRGSVEKRIAQAHLQATYLFAPVEIVATYRTYNIKTSALEHLLHRVFSDVRLDVQIGRAGQPYEASEWYSVPLPIIDEAVDLIVSGEIVNYEYDPVGRAMRARA
ncbi:MAG: GIY-YIG nuclease family protein [Actinomycetales bacterium]|nr:GIY-YIG nuclease family protein [Actinomycetales bacterium]